MKISFLAIILQILFYSNLIFTMRDIMAEPSKKTLNLTSYDGSNIYANLHQFNSAAESQEIVVFITGQGDAINMYDYVAEELLQTLSMDVMLYDVRGQGKTDGRRCHLNSLDEHLDDIQTVTEFLRSKYSKVHFVTHSTGGLIASLFILERSDKGVGSLTLVSPYFGLRACESCFNLMNGIIGTLSLFSLENMRVFPFNIASFLSTQKYNMLTHDSYFYTKFNRHPSKCGVPTVGWVKETTEAQKILKNSKSSTQVPFLMLTAGNDRIVSTEIAKQQCLNWNNSGLVKCEYYEFPEMRHGLFYEVEQTRNQLFYLINKFIKNSFDASQKIIVDL